MQVLIAEDDPVSRMILEKRIQNTGHDVLLSENGKQAWQAYLEHMPEMVITDWMMPDMNGVELCRAIRDASRSRYTYVMVLTGRREKGDLIQVLEAGADDYLTKPIDSDELYSRIKTGERIINLEKKHHGAQAELVLKNRKLDRLLDDLKKTQSNMLQTEKMASLGQLSAGLAHEINNPIGFIGGNLDALADYWDDIKLLMSEQEALKNLLIGEGSGLPREIEDQTRSIMEIEKKSDIQYIMEDIPELLKDCREGVDRIAGIVRDLKQFAQPGIQHRGPVDINRGIQSTLNMIHNEVKYKAEVETEFGKISSVKGYSRKLNQVFMNILINACQAIDERGRIKVKTFQNSTHVIISISDTGTGISAENLSKIYDPFFTTKEVGQGTGLGLSASYDIIKEHNGEIEVKSTPGQGTCFTVYLPIEDITTSPGEGYEPVG